jgi:hypothetical protein
MNKQKLLVLGIFFAALSVMSGCASVPMASDEKDIAAKTFRVQPGKSNIYVYRNESIGAAVKMEVDLDAKQIGSTAAKTYLLMVVQPGKHTITSHAENDDNFTVDALPDKNYFLWQEVKMGMLYARTKLHLVDEQTGKSSVEECKLIEPVNAIVDAAKK